MASTVTSNDGEYFFEGVLCGTYQIKVSGGQTVWTVNGEPVDPATLIPGSVSNPNANDDNDNDNNGVVMGDMVLSGEIEIGDCGEDGDFSNSASNEPTNEVDRKLGPDADPDDVSVIDGNYDDVRSNASVDIGFIQAAPCGDDAAPGAVDADGNAVDPAAAEGEICNPPCGDDAAPGAVDADGVACNDPEVEVVVAGEVECPGDSDRAGETVAPGETCDQVCNEDGTVAAPGTADATKENCEETQIPSPADIGVEVAGEVEVNPEVAEEVPVEVAGEVEVAVENLAVTGTSISEIFTLSALMVLVLGAWFYIASAWMRPVARRES